LIGNTTTTTPLTPPQLFCPFSYIQNKLGDAAEKGLTNHQGNANVAEEERNSGPALLLDSTFEVVDGALLRAAGGGRRGKVAGACHLAGDV